MNQTEKALFELRADLARNPGGMDETELRRLLAEVTAESDADLLACCLLLDLDAEDVQERAAIIQFDAGKPRTTANREATVAAILRRCPELGVKVATGVFKLASDLLVWERETGSSRADTVYLLLRELKEDGLLADDVPAEAV